MRLSRRPFFRRLGLTHWSKSKEQQYSGVCYAFIGKMHWREGRVVGPGPWMAADEGHRPDHLTSELLVLCYLDVIQR